MAVLTEDDSTRPMLTTGSPHDQPAAAGMVAAAGEIAVADIAAGQAAAGQKAVGEITARHAAPDEPATDGSTTGETTDGDPAADETTAGQITTKAPSRATRTAISVAVIVVGLGVVVASIVWALSGKPANTGTPTTPATAQTAADPGSALPIVGSPDDAGPDAPPRAITERDDPTLPDPLPDGVVSSDQFPSSRGLNDTAPSGSSPNDPAALGRSVPGNSSGPDQTFGEPSVADPAEQAGSAQQPRSETRRNGTADSSRNSDRPQRTLDPLGPNDDSDDGRRPEPLEGADLGGLGGLGGR